MVASKRVSLALLLVGSAVAFAGDTPKKAKTPPTVTATDKGKASDAKVSVALPTKQEQEQEARPEATTPAAAYAEFQFATLTGTNNVLNATLVPVVTPSGTTYVNVSLTFNVAANGTITVAAGSPAVVAAPIVGATSFRAGNYIGSSNFASGKGLITVNGPGVVAGGASVWTMTAAAGADSCTPASATWYVASPTASNNPMAARLKNAGITSTAYSYGVTGAAPSYCYSGFAPGSLIGVSQSGNSITMVSFSNGGSYEGNDQNTPVAQITFVLH